MENYQLVIVKRGSSTEEYLYTFRNPYLTKRRFECAFVITIIRIIWRVCGTCCCNESMLNVFPCCVFLFIRSTLGTHVLIEMMGYNICEGHITFGLLCSCSTTTVYIFLRTCKSFWHLKIHEAQLTSSRSLHITS